jgi:hypothetical protein
MGTGSIEALRQVALERLVAIAPEERLVAIAPEKLRV